MAFREDVRHRVHRFGEGARIRHWFHEEGMPGWTRIRGGYPCLHWSEMGYTPAFDAAQELSMLRDEADELEMILRDIRERILMLEKK